MDATCKGCVRREGLVCEHLASKLPLGVVYLACLPACLLASWPNRVPRQQQQKQQQLQPRLSEIMGHSHLQ